MAAAGPRWETEVQALDWDHGSSSLLAEEGAGRSAGHSRSPSCPSSARSQEDQGSLRPKRTRAPREGIYYSPLAIALYQTTRFAAFLLPRGRRPWNKVPNKHMVSRAAGSTLRALVWGHTDPSPCCLGLVLPPRCLLTQLQESPGGNSRCGAGSPVAPIQSQ